MNTTMQMNGIPPGQAMMMQQPPNGAMGRPGDQGHDSGPKEVHKTQLNTAIYDYFLKMGEYDLARNLRNSGLNVKLADSNKRKTEEDDSDKDPNRPSDLPAPGMPLHSLSSDTAFLLDWYSLFFDMLSNSSNKNTMASQYMNHTQNLNRLQQQQQQNIMRTGMMPANQQQQMMMRNGMGMPNGRGPIMNPQQLALQRRMMQQSQAQQAQMAREGSGMDGDGNRPRTPSSGDNAPSPSKRPRIDGQPFAPGMMNGGMPGQQMTDPQMIQRQQHANNLLLANGMPPSNLTQQQMQNFGSQNPQRANMPGQGSPNMMTPGMEMQMQNGNGDFYNGNTMNRNGAVNGGQNGHALQDYQMQLMLLERQNRKRLEMAKQEQNITDVPSQNGNMQGMFAPNMSPSGSRQGPSPNPADQMKRGTPQLNKAGIPGPGSPMPDGGPRASPSAMNYNQMGQGMENGMRPNGMQPPSSHPNFANGNPMNPQMQAMRNGQPGGPMAGGPGFQQGQMGPGGQQGGPNGQMGTPRQANAAMPPPQGVPPGNQNANPRAPSPAPSAPAGTPQQANKPNPKKKDVKKDRKASTKGKNNAAAAAAAATSEADAPPTSAPATPVTTAAANNSAFEKNKAAGANMPNGNGQANGAPAASSSQPNPLAAQTGDLGADDSMMNSFVGVGGELDFAGMEAGDVLDQFNFDAFIDPSADNLDSFNFDMGGFNDGIEMAEG